MKFVTDTPCELEAGIKSIEASFDLKYAAIFVRERVLSANIA